MQQSTDEIPFAFRRLQAFAEHDPRRAVRLARRGLGQIQADGTIAHAWATLALGWALLCWERFDQARPHIHAAQDAFTTAGLRLAALCCDYALALADLFQHASPDLEHKLAAFATRLERAGAASLAIRADLYRALLLDTLGRPHDVEDALERAAFALAADEPLNQARWLYVRGALAVSHADYAQAEALLAQSEQAFHALHNPLERAQCCFQLGWAALRQEKLDLALARYRRAQALFARLALPVRLALCDKGIGLVLTRMGRYDEALRALLRGLRLFTSLQRAGDMGACQLNLGNISFYTGQWDIALAYYRRAEALLAAAGAISRRITVQRNRAMVYRFQGELAKAERLLGEAEAQAEAIRDQSEIAECWEERAALLAASGRYRDAVLRYRQARDLFVQIGSETDAAECEVEQGWLVLRQGEIELAEDCFRSATPAIAAHPYYRWRTDYGLARCLELRGDVAAALERYRAASATVAELRGRLASEAASSGLYAQAEQLYNHSLSLAAASGALEDVFGFSESQRALVLQRALATQLATPPADYQGELHSLQVRIAGLLSGESADDAHTKAIDAALTSYGDLLLHARHSKPAVADAPNAVSETALDLARLRAQLQDAYGADWTVLVYSLSDQALLIGVLTPAGLALEQLAYDAALQWLIERAGQRDHRLSTYRDLPYLLEETAQPWERLRALADRLLPAAVRARLHPMHRLLIVPAGPLHSILWPALRLDEQWLAERAIVQLLPSLSVWQSLAARAARRRTEALLVGCSSFGGRAGALPSVGEELQAIAARWPGKSLRLADAEATCAALLERSASGELARYGLLHIASHAQMLPARGVAAHLKLWDGDLWIAEVASLRLDGALVVLSACDSALADALPGEELLSLTWAFLAAGAGAVLASLWPVDDEAVLPFMAEFYDALRWQGDAGRALADTQRALILRHRAAPGPASEPLAWGSFVLIGGAGLLW